MAVLAVAAAIMAACAGKEDYDGIDHDSKYEGETVAKRLFYKVKLADPYVTETADVLVQYIDADGTVRQDTLKGSQWEKAVTFPLASTTTYGLAARYFAKSSPTLSKPSYSFDADLASTMFQLSSKGDSMQLAVLRSDKDGRTGILKHGDSLTREEILSQGTSEDIDSTMVYYHFTSVNNDSALVRSKFEWKEQ